MRVLRLGDLLNFKTYKLGHQIFDLLKIFHYIFLTSLVVASDVADDLIDHLRAGANGCPYNQVGQRDFRRVVELRSAVVGG